MVLGFPPPLMVSCSVTSPLGQVWLGGLTIISLMIIGLS